MNQLFLRIFLPLAAILFASPLFGQGPQPRLIVGIVIDQMRYDFLYRYRDSYGENGFKRLIRQGYSCENTHYNYIPTYTAPGHAAIYSGTFPAINGVIANEWYDPEWQKHRYVTTDTTVKGVGATGKIGQHSPRVLLSSTITDELRLSNNFRSKVVGIGLKDRSSILPAGHIPNACFWFDDKAGNWITSSYYPDSLNLPQWVIGFNNQKLAEKYLSQRWERLPGKNYLASFDNWDKYDDALYADFPGNMPYDLPALRKKQGLGLIRFTPWGNTITFDFAKAAIEGMQLGNGPVTDFLALSFSSTDYIGHQFGVHAPETEDTYLRLDQELGQFLDYLDQRFGRGNVLIFLTADHGGAETPHHMEDIHVPAGVFPESKQDSILEGVLRETLGMEGNFVLEVSNQQVWLDQQALRAANVPFDLATEVIAGFIRRQPGVYDAYTRFQVANLPDDHPYAIQLRRGIHPRRSGDVYYQLMPAWHSDDNAFLFGGTTHGSSYNYDTHVPLVWYGWNIRPGELHRKVSITDIAPTLAAMLKIMEPNGATGQVIEELFYRR